MATREKIPKNIFLSQRAGCAGHSTGLAPHVDPTARGAV